MANVPTVTLVLRGGFANQLFQWAAVEWLRTKHDFESILDVRLVERPNDRGDQISSRGFSPDRTISPSRMSRQFWKLLSVTLSNRIFTNVSSRVGRPRDASISHTLDAASDQLRLGENVVLFGFYQETHAFQSIRRALRATIGSKLLESWSGVRSEAAMHVRRGDYINVPSNLAKFGVCSLDYFVSAAQARKVDVVSDDPSWCSEHLIPKLPAGSKVIVGNDLIDDFMVIATASNLVLSNSTFSWWAAFLGPATYVTAPTPWMEDGDDSLIEHNWHKRDKNTGAPI